MISSQHIKELAKTAIDDKGNINTKVSDFVLNKLTKKELKIFLRKLKKINSENSVTVIYEGNLTNSIKKNIEDMYRNKKISYERNSTLGGGIMIIDNDIIINQTVAGILDNKMSVL